MDCASLRHLARCESKATQSDLFCKSIGDENGIKIPSLNSSSLFQLLDPFLTTVRNSAQPWKDIGTTDMVSPLPLPYSLSSCAPKSLRKIRNFIGYSPCSVHDMQFASHWIVDESIQQEIDNYKKSFEEVDRRFLYSPMSSLLITIFKRGKTKFRKKT